MPISGLVITLDVDSGARALQSLENDPRVTLGELRENRLPIVTETSSLGEAEDLVTDLFHVEGILFVDVVCVDTSLDAENIDEPHGCDRERSPNEST